MSFNLKKYSQMDLGDKKFDPNILQGTTPQEKAGYVGEFLDQQLGDKVEQGEVSVQNVYQLFSKGNIGHPDFPVLDTYRKNITELRQLITQAIIRNGGDPNDENSIKQAIGVVIQKVLSRIQLKFVPELIDIYSSSTRTEEKMKPLMDISGEDIIPSVRAFLSEEIIEAKKDILRRFTETRKALEDAGISFDDIMIVINSGLKTGLSVISSKYSSEQIDLANRLIFKLSSDVLNMPNRYWNRVISLHKKLPQEELEKWAKFQFTPIEWNLKAILREAGFDTTVTKSYISRDASLYFYPELDDNGSEFQNDYARKQYALSRLKQLINNDYANLNGITRVISDQSIDESDNVGYLLQVYFRSSKICNRNKAKFFSDLDAIGMSDLREQLQDETYVMDIDKRYAAFNLILKSKAEGKLLRVFREKFNLDPIPFDFLVPSPVDCPTNESFFKLDFMLPADTLEGFDIDENNELTPIVKKKVLFLGEYFGEDRDVTELLGDKKWLNPDGSPAYYIDPVTKQKTEMKPGLDVPVRSVYGLRSRWKMLTSQTLGHIFGTDSLAIKRTEISSANSPSLLKKLDDKNIIYLYEGGTPKDGCKAIREMIDKATFSPVTLSYASSEQVLSRMNSLETMAVNIIDCQIASIKLSEGLLKAKMDFLNEDNGFYRQALYDHNLYVASLYEERNKYLYAIQRPDLGADKSKLVSYLNKINALTEEINDLTNSPLKKFKDRVNEIIESSEIRNKIQNLLELKQRVLSGEINPSIENIKVEIDNIKSGLIKNVRAFNLKKYK